MALKPTIYKTRVHLADSDRNCFEDLSLTLACHPSENHQRLTARLLAYCLNREPRLDFTRGLSSTDEPDIWLHDMSGGIEHWIEIGQPDAARLRKACGRAEKVTVYAFGHGASVWWSNNGDEIQALPKLSAWMFPWREIEQMATIFSARTLELNISIVGGTIYLDNGETSFSTVPTVLHCQD